MGKGGNLSAWCKLRVDGECFLLRKRPVEGAGRHEAWCWKGQQAWGWSSDGGLGQPAQRGACLQPRRDVLTPMSGTPTSSEPPGLAGRGLPALEHGQSHGICFGLGPGGALMVLHSEPAQDERQCSDQNPGLTLAPWFLGLFSSK